MKLKRLIKVQARPSRPDSKITTERAGVSWHGRLEEHVKKCNQYVKLPLLVNHPLPLFKYTDSKKCLHKSQDLGDSVSLKEAKS